MALELEGGCLVTGLKEGNPVRKGDLLIWNHFQGHAVSLRVLQLDGRATLRNENKEEVLYVLERDTGIHLPAGVEVPLEGAMTLISVVAPAAGRPVRRPPGRRRTSRRADGATFVRLDDVPIQRTGDRWYRELIQGEVTQFVGSIPPGRAPDHFHLYEEVLCILQGSGFIWSGQSKTPIAPGSCVYLPRRQPHCVENSTSGELRLLGVFYPAGSPAARYGVHERPESTPAEGELDRRR